MQLEDQGGQNSEVSDDEEPAYPKAARGGYSHGTARYAERASSKILQIRRTRRRSKSMGVDLPLVMMPNAKPTFSREGVSWIECFVCIQLVSV